MEELDIANITRRSAQGVLALVSRQFVLQLISLGAFLVISTHLSPIEFGTYIIVITIQQIISFFTDFGLGAALVQKKDELEEYEIATVFTIQLLITGIIFLIVLFARSYIASLVSVFTTSRLTDSGSWLLVVLTFTLFLSSFKLIPSILLERKINFQKLIIPQILESISFNIILVVLMVKGMGITSYTYAFLISSLIGVPAYYYISPWKVQLGISKKSLSHLKFGTQFQAKNILANIKDKFLTLFLGATLGSDKIGYIGFAEKWAFFVYRFVVDSVTKVTFSTYSRLQEQEKHLQRTIEKSLFFVSIIMFPVSIGVLLTMPYFIEYFPKWHNKWEPAIISIIFLCLNAMISSLSGILVNVLDATGKVKKTLQLMMIWTILTWILTPIMISLYGYNGVSIASFLITLSIVYTVYLVKQVVTFNLLKSIYQPAIATSIMGLVIFVLTHSVVHNLISLIIVIFISGIVYFIVMVTLAGREFTQDIKKLLKRYE